MSAPQPKKKKRFLAPQEKFEIWMQLVRGETTIGAAAEANRVDRATISKLKDVGIGYVTPTKNIKTKANKSAKPAATASPEHVTNGSRIIATTTPTPDPRTETSRNCDIESDTRELLMPCGLIVSVLVTGQEKDRSLWSTSHTRTDHP